MCNPFEFLACELWRGHDWERIIEFEDRRDSSSPDMHYAKWCRKCDRTIRDGGPDDE